MKFKVSKILALCLCFLVLLSGCGTKPEKKVVTIAAAASLEKIFTQRLLPLFKEKHPNIEIEGTYSGSGNLQLQIEQGLPADIFISASPKEIQALVAKGLLEEKKTIKLLENKVVLIVPKNSEINIKGFEDIIYCKQPALGNPKSVPAGQYAYEILHKLQVWEEVSKKVSFGNGVTEVLHWVAEGSADAGIVYATDALVTNKVKIVAEATPELLREPATYYLGSLTDKQAAQDFAMFLQGEEAQKIFTEYGFTIPKEVKNYEAYKN